LYVSKSLADGRFQLFLPCLDPRRVVLFGNSYGLVAEQHAHLI